MKKMLFTMALLCLFTVLAEAQTYQRLIVKNSTPCTIYVVVNGNNPGATQCQPDYRSAILAIPPGTSDYSDPTDVPGGLHYMSNTLGVNGVFNSVNVLTGNPNTCNGIRSFLMGYCPSNTTENGVAMLGMPNNPNSCNVPCNGNTADIYVTQPNSSTMQVEVH